MMGTAARAATTSDVFNAIAERQRREILILLRAVSVLCDDSSLSGLNYEYISYVFQEKSGYELSVLSLASRGIRT